MNPFAMRRGGNSRSTILDFLLPPLRLCLTLIFLFLLPFLTGGFTEIPSLADASVHKSQATLPTPMNKAVLTWKGSNQRIGSSPYETLLTPTNVNSSQFGLKRSYSVDGQVYAQPLFVPNVKISAGPVQGVFDVVYVATEHDSVYAFNANPNYEPNLLWHRSFIDHRKGVDTIVPTDVYKRNPKQDFSVEIGITGTPVVDMRTQSLFVVVMTKEHGEYVHRLHALSLADGGDRASLNSPVRIRASVKGSGEGSVHGHVRFRSANENQRGGLLLLNGVVYIPFGSFGDTEPYHGWILAYDVSNLQKQVGVYNTAPDGDGGGIWQAGQGLAVDYNDFIYFQTGNGTFSLNEGGDDASDTIVKLRTHDGFKVVDYFTPFHQYCMQIDDLDLSSGGVLILPPQRDTSHKNLLIGGGKEGRLYVVDRQDMGKYHAVRNPCKYKKRTDLDTSLQATPMQTIKGGMFSTPSYWREGNQQLIFIGGTQDHLKAFGLSKGKLSKKPLYQTSESFQYPGVNTVVSSNGYAQGTAVLWAIAPPATCRVADHCNPSGVGTLRAYNASNLGPLYSSSIIPSRDKMRGNYTKFTVPTVANGRVYVGTSSALNIYGLLAG